MIAAIAAAFGSLAAAAQAEREWSTRDVADQLLRFNAAVDALERIR